MPCGVTAYVDSGVTIGEVNTEEEELLIIRGGRGGSALNKYTGQPGEKYSVNLDLKLIADVGLIGFVHKVFSFCFPETTDSFSANFS